MAYTEEGKCVQCSELLIFYMKPGVPESLGKMEAYCQKCHGAREKDRGRPVSLEKESFRERKAEEDRIKKEDRTKAETKTR